MQTPGSNLATSVTFGKATLLWLQFLGKNLAILCFINSKQHLKRRTAEITESSKKKNHVRWPTTQAKQKQTECASALTKLGVTESGT